MAKIFISHRSADAQRAETLAVALRTVGHTVRLDTWELQIGDSITGWMNDALGDATHVVICYSDAVGGIDAPWMRREWLSALARQLNGHGIKLLPVRLSGGTPPALLADLKYADLVADWDAGVAALLRALP